MHGVIATKRNTDGCIRHDQELPCLNNMADSVRLRCSHAATLCKCRDPLLGWENPGFAGTEIKTLTDSRRVRQYACQRGLE